MTARCVLLATAKAQLSIWHGGTLRKVLPSAWESLGYWKVASNIAAGEIPLAVGQLQVSQESTRRSCKTQYTLMSGFTQMVKISCTTPLQVQGLHPPNLYQSPLHPTCTASSRRHSLTHPSPRHIATGVAPPGDLGQPHQSSPCVSSTQVDGERRHISPFSFHRLGTLSSFGRWKRFLAMSFVRLATALLQGRGNKDLSLRVLQFQTERSSSFLRVLEMRIPGMGRRGWLDGVV